MLRDFILSVSVWLVLHASLAHGQQRQPQAGAGYPPTLPDAKVEVYKTVGDVKLNLYIFNPAGAQADR